MKILGVILMIAGVVIGVYLGIWWAFIGGIVDIIDAAKAADVSGMAIAMGAAKILFFELIGGVPGVIICGAGYLAYNW
jgi:hypothetical protein